LAEVQARLAKHKRVVSQTAILRFHRHLKTNACTRPNKTVLCGRGAKYQA
jgi:hypothetical protein